MTSTLRPRGTYSGTGLKKKKRPLKKKPVIRINPPWSLTALPGDFVFVTKPTKTTVGTVTKAEGATWNEATLPAAYAALSAWADRNSLQVTPLEYKMTRYNEWSECYIWSSFTLEYKLRPNNAKYFGTHKCSSCSNQLYAGQTMCTGCTRFANCDGCYTSGLTLHGVPGSGTQYCGRCAVECSKVTCSNLVAPGDKYKECTSCAPRAGCSVCKIVHVKKELTSHSYKETEQLVCAACVDKYICSNCNIASPLVVTKTIAGKSYKRCTECVEKLYDQERKKFEKWSKAELPENGKLVIPSLSNRPIRTVSIETEFDGNGPEAAKALYRAGLIESPAKVNYSAQGGNRYPCILKSDGSVSGGELVTYLIDMDNENHAAALLRMTEVMRGCRELGHAKFTSNAGGHIHIDLHSYSIDDLWGLYTIFKYLEMPLYYLGGAGATYGHRSLKGSGYADPPTGGPYGTKAAFASGFRSSGRGGLNLNNFNGALQACRCGAVVTGDWKKCSCNLGKATAEWRLWNAEITPRILHAWIAIMQSMTAYAEDNTIREADYQYLNWTSQSVTALSPETMSKIKVRLEWMFSELVFTDDEKNSIVYALKQSELSSLGAKYLNSLTTLTSKTGPRKAKPRNPSSRKNMKFVLKASTDNLVEENGVNSSRTGRNTSLGSTFGYVGESGALSTPRASTFDNPFMDALRGIANNSSW